MQRLKLFYGQLAAIVVARGSLGWLKKIRPEASFAFDLFGFGVEIVRHQPQPFGTGKIETAAGNAEAIFSLSAEELGVQHGISRL